MLPSIKQFEKNDFRSFSAADGQMNGQMSIQLTYLNRAFHGLSIDMSHDPKHIFSIFGVVTPFRESGKIGAREKSSFHVGRL